MLVELLLLLAYEPRSKEDSDFLLLNSNFQNNKITSLPDRDPLVSCYFIRLNVSFAASKKSKVDINDPRSGSKSLSRARERSERPRVNEGNLWKHRKKRSELVETEEEEKRTCGNREEEEEEERRQTWLCPIDSVHSSILSM